MHASEPTLDKLLLVDDVPTLLKASHSKAYEHTLARGSERLRHHDLPDAEAVKVTGYDSSWATDL